MNILWGFKKKFHNKFDYSNPSSQPDRFFAVFLTLPWTHSLNMQLVNHLVDRPTQLISILIFICWVGGHVTNRGSPLSAISTDKYKRHSRAICYHFTPYQNVPTYPNSESMLYAQERIMSEVFSELYWIQRFEVCTNWWDLRLPGVATTRPLLDH